MKREVSIILAAVFCLAMCISILHAGTLRDGAQAATGSFTVPETTPAPTPTPTPTAEPAPTPTAEPTATPTASPSPTPDFTPRPGGGGGGGGGQGQPILKLTIDLVGTINQYLRDREGMLLQDAAITSRDGNIAVSISMGTIALNADGTPLDEMVSIILDPTFRSPPLTPPGDHRFIRIYDFTPDGAMFSKPIEVTFFYDPAGLPQHADEASLTAFYFDPSTGSWKAVDTILDREDNTLSFGTVHLSTYAITAEFAQATPTPPAPPAPLPPPDRGFPHWIWLIPPALILLAAINWRLYVQRRHLNRAEDEAES